MNQEYIRRDHIITDMTGEVVFTGTRKIGKGERTSINAAKRESRRLQGSDLGSGILRVVA